MRRNIALVVLVIIVLGLVGWKLSGQSTAQKKTDSSTKQTAVKTNEKQKAQKQKTQKKSVMRTPIDWRKSSETVAYPDLSKVQNFWIEVSTKNQRVYLKDGAKVIYTMYASTGSGEKTATDDNSTPLGTYAVQEEKGDFFYNAASGEGAHYWVSWKDHGIYLFHSVPTDQSGNYIVSEAEKLGKHAASHGCVRLSVPDAKWMYENLKVGTKVVIK
ncbi:L,D-transpeptidase [Liquorilactobacillus satsumensis]|uniref:L,D-transpeptidase n=1 Tax=Liquorilactobacillus satsumensis TaxID=259059 RepID=UPI0021C433DE|nr:L,D-transpeptidase [Liquorilactobacillus satsumensis]MCP9312409.1 L,D-transpeptidase [Liquorilactobacillus satsumensis]MCP9359587.1 L,D-transpeptidase [Liquorilactobacillus satsumensis]